MWLGTGGLGLEHRWTRPWLTDFSIDTSLQHKRSTVKDCPVLDGQRRRVDIARHPGISIKDYMLGCPQRTFEMSIDERHSHIDISINVSVLTHHQRTVG